LYWCKNWFLTLSEGNRLRAFEITVVKRMFESKRDELRRGLIKLHNGEIHNCHQVIIKEKKSVIMM
jgi:hypothetical protein